MKISLAVLTCKVNMRGKELAGGSPCICITFNIYLYYIYVTFKHTLNIYSKCTQGFMCLYFYPLQQM